MWVDKSTPPPLPSERSAQTSPLLSIEELERFKNLLVFAQSTVDGFFAGQHRTPYPGSSVEFRDYKDYVPGDPLDRIDWRAYGRTRRLFIRRYEAESDMTAYLVVDTSASMRYAGQKRSAKYQHAARIAAALAYLMIQQGDKAALGLFADSLKAYFPPGGTRRHLLHLVRTLENVNPQLTTGLDKALGQCADVFRKRGRLVVLSDFLTEPSSLFDALSQFLHRGFSILLLQVLDPDELDLPAQSVAQYVDMESGEQIEVDTEELRPHYQKKMRDVIDGLAREAHSRGIEHQVVNTALPYTSALEAYLGFRGRSR